MENKKLFKDCKRTINELNAIKTIKSRQKVKQMGLNG